MNPDIQDWLERVDEVLQERAPELSEEQRTMLCLWTVYTHLEQVADMQGVLDQLPPSNTAQMEALIKTLPNEAIRALAIMARPGAIAITEV